MWLGAPASSTLVGLSAQRSWRALVAAGTSARGQADRARRSGRGATPRAAPGPRVRCSAAPDGLAELILETDADLVLNAIVGSAGLLPTIATLGEGIDLALANKESLVVGGELVTAFAEATGARIIPVDSEHAALHQLILAERAHGAGDDRAPDDHGLRWPVPRLHARASSTA